MATDLANDYCTPQSCQLKRYCCNPSGVRACVVTGGRMVQSRRYANNWNSWLDFLYLKFYWITWTCSCATSRWIPHLHLMDLSMYGVNACQIWYVWGTDFAECISLQLWDGYSSTLYQFAWSLVTQRYGYFPTSPYRLVHGPNILAKLWSDF